jgi:hypothetical protein
VTLATTFLAAALLLASCVKSGSTSHVEAPIPAPAAREKTLALAKGGVTEYAVVTAAQPIAAEETAAKELAEYLKKVTGAEFKTVAESATEAKPAKAIYLGWTAFAAGKGIDCAKLGQEEWTVKTFGDDLVITGGRPWGTRWGVLDFLEKAVGVHMFDTFSEYVPSRATLEVAAPDIHVRPPFLEQLMYTSSVNNGPRAVQYDDFNRHTQYSNHRVCLSGSPGQCHTFGLYMHPNEYGKDHPEYFAMHRKADGTLYRNTDARGTKDCWFDLCLTNPEVRAIFISKLRGYIKADREKAAREGKTPPVIYEIQQNDCLPDYGCLCPDCRKIVEREGAESGLMLDFINAVADDIRADYPEVLIQTFAYNHTLKAPKHIRPRDNVMIMWCDNYGQSDWFRPLTHAVNKDMRESLESWARISKNLAVFDYWNILQVHTPGFYIPSSSISCVKPDLEYFLKNNVKRLWVCGFPDFVHADNDFDDEVHNFYALKVWLGCKLLLDPGADEKRLLDTFFAGYYGPAAGKMREFMEYLEQRQSEYPGKLIQVRREDYYKSYLDLEFFRAAQPTLDAAESAVSGDPLRLARVKRERIPVDSALLHLEPSLRKAYCAQGEAYPFDRAEVLARYAANWASFLENFVPQTSRFGAGDAQNREKARAFVEKRLEYLRAMPMLTAENIRYRALPAADGAISIDGVLDEPPWRNAVPLYLTPLNKMEETKAKTAVRTLWTEDVLYLSFQCFDDRIADMKFEPRSKDHPDTWRDSAVEIFLNPSGDRKTYYQIIVNPAGAVHDIAYETLEGQRKADDSWDSGAKLAVKINPGAWMVEMAVPFKAIGFEPKPGAVIVANFARSRRLKSDAAASQLSTWSPLLYRGFHGELDKFGAIILQDRDADAPLASFEGPQDMPVITPNNGCLVKVGQEKDRASDGASALRVEFPPTKTSVDVGVSIGCGELNDWSGASALVADVHYEGNWDKWQWAFCTRLDGESKPLHYHGVRLAPGWNKGIVLADLVKTDDGKEIDKTIFKDVKKLYLYVQTGPERTEPLVIHMDNIRLARKPGGEE